MGQLQNQMQLDPAWLLIPFAQSQVMRRLHTCDVALLVRPNHQCQRLDPATVPPAGLPLQGLWVALVLVFLVLRVAPGEVAEEQVC